MNLLFIPALFAHDYIGLTFRSMVVLSFWFFIVVACFIDLYFGIQKSKKLADFKTNSYGLRETIKKIMQYWAFMTFALMLDFGLSGLLLIKDQYPVLKLFEIPIVSFLVFVFVVATEYFSVKENIEAVKKGAVISPRTMKTLFKLIKALGTDKMNDLLEALQKAELMEDENG